MCVAHTACRVEDLCPPTPPSSAAAIWMRDRKSSRGLHKVVSTFKLPQRNQVGSACCGCLRAHCMQALAHYSSYGLVLLAATIGASSQPLKNVWTVEMVASVARPPQPAHSGKRLLPELLSAVGAGGKGRQLLSPTSLQHQRTSAHSIDSTDSAEHTPSLRMPSWPCSVDYYALARSQACLPCNFPCVKCIYASPGRTRCTSCGDWALVDGRCRRCDDPRCATCSRNSAVCEQCTMRPRHLVNKATGRCEDPTWPVPCWLAPGLVGRRGGCSSASSAQMPKAAGSRNASRWAGGE